MWIEGTKTIKESIRTWGKSEMKTFLIWSETFCGGTQSLKIASVGGAWMSRNTSTTLASCQDFPVPAEKGVHWFSPWSQPSRTHRSRVGVQIYSLDTSQGMSFDCWIRALGRIFWILLSTTGEIHWGLQKVNQRWERVWQISDLDFEMQRVWLKFFLFRLWGVLCQCSV